METVTIDLELDAYERLRALQQPGESWSEVVRRVAFQPETRIGPPYPSPAALEAQRQAILATDAKVPVTGAMLLEYYRKGGSGFSEEYLDSLEANARKEREEQQVLEDYRRSKAESLAALQP